MDNIVISTADITELQYENDTLSIVAYVNNEKYVIIVDEHIIRTMYPKIVHLNNNVYIADETTTNKIQIDIDSELGKKILSSSDIDKIKHTNFICFYNNIPYFIPNNLCDKYCIIFGTNVLESFVTEEAAIKKQNECYKYLATTLYIPQKN